MASLRNLFFAVYASNGAIRLIFLPLCYVLLLSPFLILTGYYFGFGRTMRNRYIGDLSWIDLLPQITLSAVFLLLPTRLFSGFGDASKSKDGGKRRVQSLPYWIPGLQNLFSIVSGGEQWLKSVSTSSINSIVAYTVAGSKHNVVVNDTLTSKSLLSQILERKQHLEEPASTKRAVHQNAFKLPKQTDTQLSTLWPELGEAIKREVFSDTALQASLSGTLASLKESLPDFVTFNSSIVDQMQWERVADVELSDGTSEAECNLFALVNEFCCNAVLPPILGAQFTESYQLLATDLATFNQRFWALALGLPRLSPVPGLPGAALAQKRLLQNFTKFLKDITNPPVRRVPDDDESVSGGEETDADTVTPIMKINELFTKHDLSMRVRASIAWELTHTIMAEVVPLVFWSLLRICAESTSSDSNDSLLQKVKEQTTMWAQAIQPPSIHPSFPAPPEISFGPHSVALSGSGLPLARACINETRRLYARSSSTFRVREPITIQEAGIRSGEQDTWELDAGSYIDIGLSRNMINASGDIFPDPEAFKPERFQDKPQGVMSVVSPLETHESFVSATVASIVIGIIQLWDISPAPKKSFLEHMQEAREEAKIGAAALTGDQKAAKSSAVQNRAGSDDKKRAKWVLPTAVDGASVKVPKGDIRVRIRRREGLPERKIQAIR